MAVAPATLAAAPLHHAAVAAPVHALHGAVATGYTAGPTHVHEQVHAGPAVAKTHVQHGVVGHKTVQAGTRTVQVGHQYVQAGQSVHQPAAYSLVHAPAKNEVVTKQLPIPAAPVAPAPYAAIPPAPVNLGPAPADTVTHERVLAPSRTHTIITPQATRIEPELQVNKYQVDVPVAVPTPVEREVIVHKHVPKPYEVEVPTPYAVPQPYPVHQVKHVVETPVIEKQTYTVSHPVAVQQTVHHAAPVAAATVGYAAAPAIAAHGVVGAAAHGVVAGAVPVGAVAAHGVAAHGYAGYAAAPAGLVHGAYAHHGLVAAAPVKVE